VKILVLGATGLTGTQILKQAAEAGHEVRALVRNPAKLAPGQADIEVVTGDATDFEAVTKATKGVDAVLVALGAGHNRQSDLASRSATVVSTALGNNAPKRVVILSSFGVGDSFSMASPPQRLLYRTVLRSLFADKATGDETWRTSLQNWTVVRPVTLTNGPVTGEYAAVESLEPRGFPRITRADVAHFMVAEAQSSIWSRQTVILSPSA